MHPCASHRPANLRLSCGKDYLDGRASSSATRIRLAERKRPGAGVSPHVRGDQCRTKSRYQRISMVYRHFPIRSSFAAALAIGLGLGGCAAYGPAAGYPASPYGYYGDYNGYAYPPGYAYAPGFFGSPFDFGAERRFRDHRHFEERRRERAEHRGHGPGPHAPGPVHVAPAGRGAALSGRSTPPHSAPQGHGKASSHSGGNYKPPHP